MLCSLARNVHHEISILFACGILQAEEVGKARPPLMKQATILCVDDDPRIRGLYEGLLGSHGYKVHVASSGRQALKLFHSHEEEIDAVILDYEMPKMNGVELAAELKHCDATLPVIMISGYDLPSDLTPFADAFMAKGAPVEKLLACIQAVLAVPPVEVASSEYVPLGSALLGVAMASLVLGRFWR
jgi:CheY-like chemotaxis protein